MCAAQPPATRSQAAPVGKLGAAGAADHHVLDGSRAVEQNPDLSADVIRDGGHLSCEVIGDDAVVREPAPGEAFERLDLAGLEASRITVDLDGVAPAEWVRGSWGIGGIE